jgi:NADH:ubiquinone oxidoreductase subunit 6 (subunit J)
MMLEVKTIPQKIFLSYISFRSFIRSFFISIILFELFSLFNTCFISLNYGDYGVILNSGAFTLDKISNIESLGQLLYTYFYIYFLIAAMVLLVVRYMHVVLSWRVYAKKKNMRTR